MMPAEVLFLLLFSWEITDSRWVYESMLLEYPTMHWTVPNNQRTIQSQRLTLDTHGVTSINYHIHPKCLF